MLLSSPLLVQFLCPRISFLLVLFPDATSAVTEDIMELNLEFGEWRESLVQGE